MRVLCALLTSAVLSQAAPATLAIVKPTLHQFEDGPPVYADHRFVPGDTVWFSFQVENYRTMEQGEERKVLLSYRIDAMDSQKTPLVEPMIGKVDTTLKPQDKDWMPKIRHSFLIPPHALPGSFRIAAAVKDELSGQEASIDIAFSVRGRQVELSDALAVRNFRFLRDENDTVPKADAAYRPGDTLWAKFDITGFHIGGKNHIRVEYGISILNSEGKVLYSQPDAAVEEKSPFYPMRYVPGAVSLNIQPGTPAAEYGLLVTVRDAVGQQTIESRHTFRIQ